MSSLSATSANGGRKTEARVQNPFTSGIRVNIEEQFRRKEHMGKKEQLL